MNKKIPGRNKTCSCGSGKKYKKCCESFDQKVAQDFLEILNNVRDGNFELAERMCKRILLVKPEHEDTLNVLGYLMSVQGRLQEGEEYLSKLVKLDPDNPSCLANLGDIIRRLDRTEEAIPILQKAIKIKPSLREAYNNIGACYKELGRLDEAIESYSKALEYEPTFSEVWNNIGVVYSERGEIDKAIECYYKALEPRPDRTDTPWNISLALLMKGEMKEGWEMMEKRWLRSDKVAQRPYHMPWWDGSPLGEKKLLAWMEQGLGDEIRYANLLIDLSPCTVECDPRLVSLFERSFPQHKIIPKVEKPTEEGYDLQIPVASIGKWTRNTINCFPKHTGYIKADPAKVESWKQHLAELLPGFRIGFCWRSGWMNSNRTRSHTRIEQWEPLLKIPDVHWINLQYGDCRGEVATMESQDGITIHEWEGFDIKTDQEWLSALMMNLDLVITTGTSVGELAGALGVPVWVMNLRHVNWDDFGTGKIPWYPSMRMFWKYWDRPWGETIEEVRVSLVNYLAERNEYQRK